MAYYNPPNTTHRRRYRKRVQYAKKTYKKVYGSRNVPQAIKATANTAKDVASLMYQVAQIRSRLNVEKKHIDRDVSTAQFGQVNVNNTGFMALDVTPSIAQGVTGTTRIGNSVKLTGMSFPIQFSGMSKTISARKIKVMLFRVSSADNGVDVNECIADYLDGNPLNGIIDYNSQKAYRSHKNDGIKLIRQKVYTLPAVPTTMAGDDETANDTELSGFSAKFNVKCQDVLRYASNGDTTPDGIRYFIYFFADKGNKSPTSNSTLDVPVRENDTGVRLRMSQRSWIVDN
ncbi:MAG: coat protein [Cressdnaviricota sp.]|nr:MAG: coat protein [Cressdnaviricota sp.]